MHDDGSSPQPCPRVAVIGGGVTGATAVARLAQLLPKGSRIVCFDQGRNVGGRACSRFVRVEDGERVGPEELRPCFAYDHGCQFFRADSQEFQQKVLPEWLAHGWASEWRGRFGVLPAAVSSSSTEPDSFFGVPSSSRPVYCGVGGMHKVPSGILAAVVSEYGRCVTVRTGERISGVEKASDGGWLLQGTTGQAALHTTKEEEASKVAARALADQAFDAVLVTDVSASFESWHRASAGLPECARDLVQRVRARVRIALFTCFVTFEAPLSELELDGIAFHDATLWFAARNASKPGFEGARAPFECWTLISTPAYAASEIERVPMQDPVTGAFLPQEPGYLLSDEGPCQRLLKAFAFHVGMKTPLPKVLHMDGQRWGSAFPAPVSTGGRDRCGFSAETSVSVMGVRYDKSETLPLMPASDGALENETDFFADEDLRLFYAGDYVSSRSPGVEAAALSGLHAAEHIASLFATDDGPASGADQL